MVSFRGKHDEVSDSAGMRARKPTKESENSCRKSLALAEVDASNRKQISPAHDLSEQTGSVPFQSTSGWQRR